MSVSDRSYFLDSIKNNPMTIKEIVDTFNCATVTARNWVKHDEVERVPGSYPPSYVRKDTLILGGNAGKPNTTKATSKAGKVSIDLDLPPQEEVEAFFHKILAGEQKFDFVEEFRSVDSQKSLHKLIAKLKSALVVSEYYRQLMIKDGID